MEYWHQCLLIRPLGFSFWIRLGVICQSHMFYFENGSPVTFWNQWNLTSVGNILVLSFSLLHHAYLRCKNACTHPHVLCFAWSFSKKNPYYPVRGHQISNDKIARKLPLVILIGWSLDIARYLEFTSQKKTRDYCFDMENEKTPRMEELESGQQKMQEKISWTTKMVIKLTKGKGITDDPRKPAS